MKVIGIDIGGTFTDLVALDLESGVLQAAKSFTVRGDESKGVLACLGELGLAPESVARLVHGTTIGTNAILERRGATTAVLTTRGFRDLLEIGRTRRMAADTMFSLTFRRPPPLVPRPLRFDIPERMAASGSVIGPLDEDALIRCLADLEGRNVRSIAVCYLHSYANPAHEIRTREIIADRLAGVCVSLSHEVVPEYREFERLSTTVLNAYVAPLMQTYLGELEASLASRGAKGGLFVMASSGGAMSALRAKEFPVQTVLSGPAGGVSAAVLIGRAAGLKNLITCDMGGTSTDVAMIRNLEPRLGLDNVIGGLPLKVPQVDINTVGAGGGSVAELDAHGQLHVGPRSAGADPGPICYGRGGTEVTVTDANLVLQRLALRKPLGGKITPSLEAARPAMRALAERVGIADEFQMAAGVIKLAVAKMVASIREISISRGHDPRTCTLMPFGGAGPMHATQVAEELHIPTILIPVFAGNLSALGLLTSDIRHDLVATVLKPNSPKAMKRVAELFREMRRAGHERLIAEGFDDGVIGFARVVDMRYRGQAFEIGIPVADDESQAETLLARFHEIYASLYGHANPDQEAEIVNVRLAAIARTEKPALRHPTPPGDPLICRRTVYFDRPVENVPVYDRDLLVPEAELAGPAIVEEAGATTVVFAGWSFSRDRLDNLRLVRTS